MHKALTHQPVLDEEAFHKGIESWKRIVQTAKPGYNKIVVEWNIGKGPTCLVFPMSLRHLAIDLTADTPHKTSDERWADFLEFEFVPKVVAALEADGFKPLVNCTDQRPILVMREKRRSLAAAGREKTGVSAHH